MTEGVGGPCRGCRTGCSLLDVLLLEPAPRLHNGACLQRLDKHSWGKTTVHSRRSISTTSQTSWNRSRIEEMEEKVGVQKSS